MWKGATDSKKQKKRKKRKLLSKSDIKKQLLESIIINKVVESEELNREAKEVQNPEKSSKTYSRVREYYSNEEKRNCKYRVSSREGF